MKFLVVLSAIAACAAAAAVVPAAKPYASYAYSAISPLITPYAYASPYAAYPYAAYPYAAPFAAPYAAAPYAVAAPVGVKTQYYAQDIAGQVAYGFSEPAQAQSVVQDAAGNKVGSFSYINAEGKLVQTNYVADALGYRVASNDLPAADLKQPTPVADTPEVAAAKASFFAEFEKTKSRSRRSVAVQTPASTTPLAAYPYSAAYPYAAYPYAAYPYSTAYPYSAYPYSAAYPYAAYPYNYAIAK